MYNNDQGENNNVQYVMFNVFWLLLTPKKMF